MKETFHSDGASAWCSGEEKKWDYRVLAPLERQVITTGDLTASFLREATQFKVAWLQSCAASEAELEPVGVMEMSGFFFSAELSSLAGDALAHMKEEKEPKRFCVFLKCKCYENNVLKL